MTYAIGDIVMMRRDAGPAHMWRARVLWLKEDGTPEIIIDVDETGRPTNWETREVSQPWHVTPLTADEQANLRLAA